jgi:hypothetical protein
VSEQGDKSSDVDWNSQRAAAKDPNLVELRRQLTDLTVVTFTTAGDILHVGGHIIGSDRLEGRSPFGHGSDETVAVSLLLRIASELISAARDLFGDGRHYAAAALLRQLVEIEYLAWAFDTGNQEGERWLRSTASERQSFFTPAKLRKASGGRFRSKDYGYHCEQGGHPVPGASVLLTDNIAVAQLLVTDLLGHAGRIWNHVASWARRNGYGPHIHAMNERMAKKYSEWNITDPLNTLPPPS